MTDMKYSIIDAQRGEKCGFDPKCHRLAGKGTKIVVNENELKKVNEDTDFAARSLGGVLMTHVEVINELKREEE